MQQDIQHFYSNLWQDYIAITPSAAKIHALLGTNEQGTSHDIVNDHVAFRTFNLAKVNLQRLTKHFINMGYSEGGQYHFTEKKLDALHFEHPDPSQPKVFISELKVELFSPAVQSMIEEMVAQIDDTKIDDASFLYSGTHWQVSQQTYQSLLTESEYAAWMSAWGFRANHFTVCVNQLSPATHLEQVNQRLKDAGFVLNTSGGEIKGGADVFLAQSSTMADSQAVNFSDGTLNIPSCFYEFAERFAMDNGELYQGFVEASANKIFESTNSK